MGVVSHRRSKIHTQIGSITQGEVVYTGKWDRYTAVVCTFAIHGETLNTHPIRTMLARQSYKVPVLCTYLKPISYKPHPNGLSAALTSLTNRHPFRLAPPAPLFSTSSQRVNLLRRGVVQIVDEEEGEECEEDSISAAMICFASGELMNVRGREGRGRVERCFVT